jgi:hypothetical protein
MKNYPALLFTSFIITAISIALGGCASTEPARFYTLHSISDKDMVSRASAEDNRIFVGIGPIEVPDYLDRPQIVTRSGINELKYAEYDRWAGSFEEDVARVLVENLSALLSDRQVAVLRWGSSAQPSFPFNYRVTIQVIRFERTVEGPALLKTQWTIYEGGGKGVLLMRDSSISEQTQGDDYASLVEAMSRALAKLSGEIASAIVAL